MWINVFLILFGILAFTLILYLQGKLNISITTDSGSGLSWKEVEKPLFVYLNNALYKVLAVRKTKTIETKDLAISQLEFILTDGKAITRATAWETQIATLTPDLLFSYKGNALLQIKPPTEIEQMWEEIELLRTSMATTKLQMKNFLLEDLNKWVEVAETLGKVVKQFRQPPSFLARRRKKTTTLPEEEELLGEEE